MQVSCQRSNVFGICHYPKKHSDGNDKSKQHSDLASPQKHKRLAETAGIHRILPKHDTKYAEWTSSMTDLLQKDKKFEWGPDQALGLTKLKKHFAINKPLAMHDPKKQTELQTDVSDRAIKAMVFQQRNFLDYYSKKLTPAEANYTIGDKKMFAVVVALKHWRHLTQRAKHKMLVHIDHKGLMCFFGNKTVKPKAGPVVKRTRML